MTKEPNQQQPTDEYFDEDDFTEQLGKAMSESLAYAWANPEHARQLDADRGKGAPIIHEATPENFHAPTLKDGVLPSEKKKESESQSSES